MRRKLATSLLLFTLANLGCTGSNKPCFPPASLVLDTRVLAVQSDPPEAVVDPSGVDPIAPVNIAALVVSAVSGLDGEYGRAAQDTSLHTSIYVCLAATVADVNAQPGCPGARTQIADLTAVPTMASPFTYTPPLSLIQEAIAQDPVHGLGGVKLIVQLDFVDASTTPSTTLSATKTLSFQLKGSLQTLNHGLVLTGMETSVDGVHTNFSPTLAIALVVTQVSGLRPLIGPGAGGSSAIETYLAYDNSGVLTQFEEHVTYAFYAGNALFFGTSSAGAAIYNGAAGDVADEPEPGTPDPPDGLVSTEPVYPGDQGATFFVIARDDRGAVTWAEVPYFAKELRAQCSKGGNGSLGKCPVALYGCN